MLCGIDLGGTKIEGVVFDEKDPSQPIWRKRIATEAHLGYEHIVKRVGFLFEMMRTETGVVAESLGVGTPGIIDPFLQTMKNCNTVCLNQRPLKKDLENTLGLPVLLANDANCFALAEALLGAGQGAPTVFGIILGTGVGGGLVVDGKVLQGRHGIAGEWGHNILMEEGPQCYCGKRGCVETILSGPALERYYSETSGGLRHSLSVICEKAEQGDATAEATLQRLEHYFGKALAVVLNIFDPDVVIVGGGVGNVARLHQGYVPSLQKYLFNNRLDTRILRPSLGDSAGVFGAALLTR